MRCIILQALACLLVGTAACPAGAAEYRVGAMERYKTLSKVAANLAPGDVVVLASDLAESVVFANSGAFDKPIVIRGELRVDGGKMRRPVVRPVGSATTVMSVRGNNYRIENLEFDGRSELGAGKLLALQHDCDNLTIKGCYFHHFNFKAVCGSPTAGSITVEFCEFESCGSTALNGKSVDVWSWTPGSVMRVEHCYFHDALGQCHIKTHCPRNIVRYNWFENAYSESINITDRLVTFRPMRPEGVYPMHSDIVGNVFVQGLSPGQRYSTLSSGGHGTDEPGPEGDINIAHNLFIMNVFGQGDNATVYDLVQGNVDHVKMCNNVFLQIGGPCCLVYLRDLNWDTPDTRDFIKRRGSPHPIVEGSNNWIYERSIGIPASFKNTLRGLNPKLVDLLNGDYRPRRDSPLAGAGLWPLPKGRIVDLVPEYEPQRGIPADLKPKPRRKLTPPSIGPFETPE